MTANGERLRLDPEIVELAAVVKNPCEWTKSRRRRSAPRRPSLRRVGSMCNLLEAPQATTPQQGGPARLRKPPLSRRSGAARHGSGDAISILLKLRRIIRTHACLPQFPAVHAQQS